MTQPTNQSTLNPNSLSQTALNVILVVLETLLTLLLRFDAPLRTLAYPLAKQGMVVCIRSYVPHATVYATFSPNGILLDSELQPSQQVDVTINGFSFQILQAIFTHNTKVIDQLQLRGEADNVALLRQFLLGIGVVQVVQNIIANFKNKKQASPAADTDQAAQSTGNKLGDYRRRIEQQETTINDLTIEQTRLRSQVAELNSKNKVLKIALAVAGVIILALLLWLILR